MSKLKEGTRVRVLHGGTNIPESVWGKPGVIYQDKKNELYTMIFDEPDPTLHNGGIPAYKNRAWFVTEKDVELLDAPPRFKGGEIVVVKDTYPKQNMPILSGPIDIHGMKGRIHTRNGKAVTSVSGAFLVKFPKPHPSLHYGNNTLDKRQGWFINADYLQEVPGDEVYAVILEKLGE